jgi:hypothetical protein
MTDKQQDKDRIISEAKEIIEANYREAARLNAETEVLRKEVEQKRKENQLRELKLDSETKASLDEINKQFRENSSYTTKLKPDIKIKSTEYSKKVLGSKVHLLILFFPITIYLFLASVFLIIIYNIEQVIEILANYSKGPGYDYYSATAWHKKGVMLALFFPLAVPVLFVWNMIVFMYFFFASVLRFAYNTLKYIWEQLTEIVTSIWEWTVESIQQIWEQISRFMR